MYLGDLGRKILLALDVIALGGDALDEVPIARVGTIVLRLVAQHVQIQIDLECVAGDAQVFKPRAQECHGRNIPQSG